MTRRSHSKAENVASVNIYDYEKVHSILINTESINIHSIKINGIGDHCDAVLVACSLFAHS